MRSQIKQTQQPMLRLTPIQLHLTKHKAYKWHNLFRTHCNTIHQSPSGYWCALVRISSPYYPPYKKQALIIMGWILKCSVSIMSDNGKLFPFSRIGRYPPPLSELKWRATTSFLPRKALLNSSIC